MLDAVQTPQPDRSSEKMNDRLRALLAVGAGTLVVASAVVVVSPAAASPPPLAASVIERVEAVRAQFLTGRLMQDPANANGPRLAWHAWHDWQDYPYHDQVWNNVPSWHNLGYQDPRWQNWQNWHDWNNAY